MSGSFAYELRDGVTRHPMANVKVVLRDIWIDVFGQQVWTEIASSSTGADGSYGFTYTVDMDHVGTPDVVVCALAVDKEGEVADVSAPYAGGTWACTGEYWENNAGDRLQRNYVDESAGRVVFRLLDAVRSAHSNGYERSSIDITYPANWFVLDSGSDGCYQDAADTIHIGDGAGWGATIFHEYGHAWMYAAYNKGGGDNAYDDYESAADSDYSTFFSEEDRWTAFSGRAGRSSSRCAWAAATVATEVRRATSATTTRRAPTTATSSTPSPGSSGTSTTILRRGSGTPGRRGPRARGPAVLALRDARRRQRPGGGDFVGPGDRAQAPPRLPLPRDHQRSAHAAPRVLPGNTVLLRGIDGAFYRQGVVADINENVPHIDAGTVLVTGAKKGSAYTGTLTLWCRVTDADSPGGASDLDRIKVRFEGSWDIDSTVDGRRAWGPLTCTLQKAAGPPPGQSGSGWFKAEWDTTAMTPVAITPTVNESSTRYAYFVENRFRRRERGDCGDHRGHGAA